MTGQVEAILERWGQTAELCRVGRRQTVRAFIQPVRERDEVCPEAETPLGRLDGRLWLYLGRAAAETGDTVVWNGTAFRVRSGRPLYIGGALSHWRAVLERERETVCGN